MQQEYSEFEKTVLNVSKNERDTERGREKQREIDKQRLDFPGKERLERQLSS